MEIIQIKRYNIMINAYYIYANPFYPRHPRSMQKSFFIFELP